MIENGKLGAVHCIYVMYNIYHPEVSRCNKHTAHYTPLSQRQE
jgi:hypothetical protein